MAVPGSGGEEEDENGHPVSARAVTHSLAHRNLSFLHALAQREFFLCTPFIALCSSGILPEFQRVMAGAFCVSREVGVNPLSVDNLS